MEKLNGELLTEAVPLSVTPKEHGRLYWFTRNILTGGYAVMRRRPIFSVVMLTILAYSIFIERQLFQSGALWVRTHIALIVAIVLFLFIVRFVGRGGTVRKIFASILLIVGLGAGFWWGEAVHRYFSLWYRYESLKIVALKALPETGHERIQPLNSMLVTAQEKLGDTERALTPDFVRIGAEYRWTMAIEPEYDFNRLVFGKVASIFNLSGTDASPDWSHREKVNFDVGEGLIWSHNSHTCVRRGFSPWRFMSYEPAEVRYLKNDAGVWVQVVTLVRWEGFIFPRPTFGGVVIVRQAPGSPILGWARRVFTGCGEWVSPAALTDHAFLLGQNVQSYMVSRYVAESFRFQNGFLAPMPGYHVGDIRIPDLPDDVNPQPFTTYFETVGGGKLYHYFALEPYSLERQGLSTSVLVPGDGDLKVYVVSHGGSSLTGVSAVDSKIVGSRKEYDWSKNHTAEHRPFVRKVNGVSRLYWLSTVVTKKGTDAAGGSVAGETPDVVLTDALTNQTRWVKVTQSPEEWLK